MRETPGSRKQRAAAGTAALLVGAAVVLGACSHGTGDKASSAAARLGTAPAASGSKIASEAVARPTVPKGEPLSSSRQVIYTAGIAVRVSSVSRAAERAQALVNGAGGYLFSENANLARERDATLVFKVPPIRFDALLDQLGGLGSELDRHIDANDVTDQVVDLRGRLAAANASTARLRALFTNAQNVPDVVAIENELATREAEVESLQGQLRVVQNQVALATVTLTLTTTAAVKPTASKIPGFSKALSGGWGAFVNTGKVILTAVGATLPFVVVAGVAGAIFVPVRRRRRAAHALSS